MEIVALSMIIGRLTIGTTGPTSIAFIIPVRY